jgi:TonB family protein
MELSAQEENKNRIISAAISLLVFGLILLFLVFFVISTPNPPFAIGGGGGSEMALGMVDAGNDVVEYGSLGKVTDVVTEAEPSKQEEIITDPNSEVEVKEETRPDVKNNTTVITPVKETVKPKEKTAAEKLKEKFIKNQGNNGGGIGNNSEAGQNGNPDGDPFKNGTGGSGTGNDGGNGPGRGPGGGPGYGGGKFGFDLNGRNVITKPKLPSDTKEEGKVVVEIVVDKEGNVIEANPIGRGTTTNSALLKAKARQAAMATKFSSNGQYEEQRGTITIIFAFE